ncbi:CAZyme family GH18 [Paecilomyces variotii]|nr:CAZyme family GH18 [Paecilomyces variotii]
MWFSPSGAVATCLLLLSPATVLSLHVDGGSDNLSAYLAAHPVATKAAAAVSTFADADANANTLTPELVNAVLSQCPSGCVEAGLNPRNWTVYPQLGRLAMCNQTMLLDFSLFTSLRKDGSVRACTTNSTEQFEAAITRNTNTLNAASCLSKGSVTTQVQQSLQLAFNQSRTPATVADFDAAAQQLAAALSQRNSSDCTDTTAFAYSNSVALGLFAGSGVGDVPAAVLQQLLAKIKTSGFSSSAVVQLCAQDGRSSEYSFGIVASGERDVYLVQDAVAAWASAECITTFDDAEDWLDITLSVPSLVGNSTTTTTTTNSTVRATLNKRALNERAECSTIQVVSGDSCASLAAKCGISASDFDKYNPSSTLCSTLVVGQHVCCSAGTLPDYRPQPNANGTCASHYVEPGESCASLAAANDLTNAEIESFNTDTWAWEGCDNLQAYQYICLSKGDPPMPAPVANAVCGPQKPGTQQPASGVSLASLNPCPLNACCNKYGQCGITPDFCTESKSATGAPGTSAPGQNGCISNCGTDVVVGDAPAEYINIGYFEGYNLERPCLNMEITAMDLTPYTHIHLSFGEVSTSYEVDISSIQDQWELFQQLSGFKKILSLGGWSFSTDPATYSIFREGVQPGNQDTFVANIVSFVTDNDLDGIDIDWEYPAAPDIPGIPAGSADDTENYLTFITKLRSAMPSGKSVSFCAPASYWYLRGYSISKMAAVADYVVYMTYDLHGQWDYAHPYAIDGCPAGNCLRSQVNLTETLQTLAMITKAGVPSNKIAVGVSSYGRSFQMTTPGCTGPMCTYTGGGSGAYPGPCTQTAGYIANAEINAILNGTGSWEDSTGAVHHINSFSSYLDTDSQSNIAVYDSTQWVGYMDDSVKQDRSKLYESLHMAGVIDWAIDLDGYGGDDVSPGPGGNLVYPPQSIWDSPDPQIGCTPPCIIVLPPYPLTVTHTVTSWPPLTTTLLSSDTAGGGVYVKTTTIPVPAFSISEASLQPVTLYSTDTDTYTINPVQSITPSSFIWTLPPDYATFPVTTPTPMTSRDTTVPLTSVPSASFFSTPVPVTIQPQPTYSVEYPKPPVTGGPLTVKASTTEPSSTKTSTTSSGTSPSTSCTGSGCGKRDCSIFGCGGSTSSGGGSSGGGCGCTSTCPLGSCGGLGCTVPGGCGNTQGPDGGDSSECEVSATVSACTYLVTSYSAWYLASSTTTTETDCVTKTACNGQDTAVTTTPGSPECTIDPDVQSALSVEQAAEETIINGQQIPLAFEPTNPAGYDGSTFTLTQFGLTDTLTVVKTSTVTIHPTTTVTVVVPPTAQADCAYWITDFFYIFEVYNIAGWSTDGGSSLNHEEKGCGALTGWEWHEHTDTQYSRAYFNLPFIMKSGCVERAIVSAGGPKLSCEFQDYDFLLKKKRSAAIDPPPPAPSWSTLHRRDLVSETPSFPSGLSTASSNSTRPATTAPLYTPESWGPGNTETFTTTLNETSKSTYTTEIVLATGANSTTTGSKTTSTQTTNTTTTSTTTPTPTTTPTTTTTSPTTTTSGAVATPTPTQAGMVSNCKKFYYVKSGDGCQAIATAYGITLDELYTWNPALNGDCTGLWADYYICVGV